MPNLQEFEQDYWAPDREDVLSRMRGQGQPVQQEQQQQQQRPWDRTAFRDEWMGSGIGNVGGMQDWLKNTGWGQHVGTAGSKGDVMQLPGGENIDAVLAAGLGGNRGGPQWTGRGNWNQMGGGMQPMMANPSYQMMGNMFGGGQGFGGVQQGGMQGQGGMTNRMYNRPQQMQQRMNPTTGQKFQSRGFGMQQQQPAQSRQFQTFKPQGQSSMGGY